MKGFIEITAKDGRKRLLNITRIEEVINSTIYLDVINPDAFEQDHVKCEESYEEIKAKIAEAVSENTRIIAKWEISSDGYYPYCSNCKNEPKNKEMTDYCPNCGAKMKGR